jgi:DNA-binding transcriptional LysR family regulator
MQGLDWNDLRCLLALARSGSFAGAARLLRLDATTVARRLRALERMLGTQMFERDPGGALKSTGAGIAAIARAETIEAEIAGLAAAMEGTASGVQGRVRLTTVPILANRILIPALPRLLGRNPGLKIDLMADARGYDLARREADIALRFARPDPALGHRILGRRLASLHYAPYAAAGTPRNGAGLPWLGYDESLDHLPQAVWLRRAKGPSAAFAANDAESLIHATAAGLGRTLLPQIIGDAEPRLTRLRGTGLPPLPTREVWLLTHRDLRPLPRVAAVVDWLAEIFA